MGTLNAAYELPEAPLPQQAVREQKNPSAPISVGTAPVSGAVLDSSGAVIRGAQVALVLSGGRQVGTLQSGLHGEYAFTYIPAGSYVVTVDAAGFAPFTTKEFSVNDQQSFLVPEIVLSIAGTNTDLVVRPSEVVAAEQIKAEEKQRLLGVFPNFYVSYVPDAAPLTSKQKFSLAAHDTFDWTSFVGTSVGAGIEQANNTYKGYGQGAAGYGKRWGASFADERISDFLSRYVFASAFHQDPRYFYQGTGTNKSRFYHAVSNAFIARSDSGKTMPNYSYLLGDIFAGAISNAYHPESDRGAGLVFTNAGIGIAGRAFQGMIQEFVAKRLTKHVPDPGQSQSPQPAIAKSMQPKL